MIALFFAVACNYIQPVEAEGALDLVSVHDVTSIEIDAHMPTDLEPMGDALVVLDGYESALITVTSPPTRTQDPALGKPIRLAPRTGGWWAVDPGDTNREGALLQTDPSGHVVTAVPLGGLAAVSVVDLGGDLAVGTRDRGIVWLDPNTGEVEREVTKDVDGFALGGIADLVPWDDGGLLAVDMGQSRVHILDASGNPIDTLGNWGLSAGRLFKPRSVVEVPGHGYLVADAGLGNVQLFDTQGGFIGVLADGKVPLGLSNPVAIRLVRPDTYAVLDSGNAIGATARVVSFRLTAADIEEKLAHPEPRHLRVQIGDAAAGREKVAGVGGESCLGCHDGYLNDSRQVWDKRRHNHPLEVPEGFEIPEELPVKDGKMDCTTCHSPHAGSGEVFLRLPYTDGTLCRACHGEHPHNNAAAQLAAPGGAHPTGTDLRGDDALAGEDCSACHVPHDAGIDPLLRDETDGKVCLACHEKQRDTRRNHPLGVIVGADVPHERRGAQLVHARDGGLGCRTCHDLVGGRGNALLARPADGGAICFACHSDREAVRKGAHNQLGHDGVPCLGCHEPHGRPIDDKLLIRADGGCTHCHEKIAAAPGHPRSGAAPQCLTCHDPHAAAVRPDKTCASCHEDESAGHADYENCAACHPPHEAPPRVAVSGGNVNAGRCLVCHGEGGTAKTIESWRHPELVFTPEGSRWEPLAGLVLFDKQGNRVPDGQMGELSCGSCHVPHGDKLMRPGDSWKAACSSCHGDETLIRYRYYHRPDRRESR